MDLNTLTCGGVVASVTMTAGGSGYTGVPTVAFSGGGGSGAAGTATIAGGQVTGVTMSDGGTGYTSAPTVAFSGGSGTGATATANVPNLQVAKPPGLRGYSSTISTSNTFSFPIVFSGGGASLTAVATANVSGGAVASITIYSGGGGYTGQPSISGGGGSSLAVTWTITSGKLTGYTITNAGSGYTTTVNDSTAIYLPYLPGDVIYINAPQGGTGLSGITLQDMNIDGRSLGSAQKTCENQGGSDANLFRLFVCSTPFS